MQKIWLVDNKGTKEYINRIEQDMFEKLGIELNIEERIELIVNYP